MCRSRLSRRVRQTARASLFLTIDVLQTSSSLGCDWRSSWRRSRCASPPLFDVMPEAAVKKAGAFQVNREDRFIASCASLERLLGAHHNYLFISKRVDGIHSCCLSCRIESKKAADGSGKGHCEQDVCNVDDHRPAANLRDKYAKGDPDQHP
jgi:hypothetical protein